MSALNHELLKHWYLENKRALGTGADGAVTGQQQTGTEPAHGYYILFAEAHRGATLVA